MPRSSLKMTANCTDEQHGLSMAPPPSSGTRLPPWLQQKCCGCKYVEVSEQTFAHVLCMC